MSSMQQLRDDLKTKFSPAWVERKQAEARQRGRVNVQPLCRPDCDYCGGSGTYIKHYGPEWYEFACHNSRDLQQKRPHQITWDTIPDEGNIAQVKQAIRALLSVGSGWLYLWGKPGRGKTTMLKAAQNHPSGHGAYYTDTLAVIDDLRGSFDEPNGQKTLQIRQDRWIKHKVLFLDEFDRVGTTDFVKERLYRVMDGRYQQAVTDKGLTVMVSNSPPSALDAYLRDRVEEFQVLEVRTPESLRL